MNIALMWFLKKIHITALVLLLTWGPLFSRVFFVGSNPHLTIKAFPQDIFLVPNDFVYYYASFQRLPWWGDVDEIQRMPHETYLATGEKLNEAGTQFEHNASATAIYNMAGFSQTYSDKLKMRYDLAYTATPLRNRASGYDAATSTSFEYRERHTIHNIYVKSLCAIMAGNIPVGFKLGLGTKLNTQPNLKFDITQGGQDYTSNRLIWAWSASQGPDVLGSGNGEFHNYYALGPLFRVDAQTAATLPGHKMGVRFRYEFGNLKQHEWTPGTPGSVDSDFSGQYTESDWVKKIRTITGRAYVNYTWFEREKFRFNTLALTRYTVADSTGILMEDQNVDNGIIERSKTFVFQVNPNVNIYPWGNKLFYIDAAILCNYSHMRYDYSRPYWVGGGEIISYVGTTGYAEDDYTWRNFSYGRRNFFEVAGDIHTVFPCYGSSTQSLAVGLSLLLWTRYKWFNKYYGSFIDSTSTFDVNGVRRNFDRESWLNSVINVIYRRGNFNYRLDIGQPLIYTLFPRTEVSLDNGESYKKRREGMWLSQGGLKLGFFVSTSLESFKRMYGSEEM
jgi:hypothetical protein